ncbi:CIS tube protein [Agarilytica rhodophyticola]|uniref:CIS tube protein n=1 Tax=Agarilytica rhodophyticola TaxID=1737490 RepID=UPI000B3411DC|nr:hypothetical protein [Agarilytica rhodophyticola]
MALQKATIEILDKEAINPSIGLPARIEVQFNPQEYSLSKGAQVAEINIPGIDSPILQFIRGQNEKLSLELFFDTTRPQPGQVAADMGDGARDVRKLTRSIYQLVKIQPRIHAQPRIRFYWGNGISFKAIVESVQQKFTLFNAQGVPLRAKCSVSFREYKTLEEQLKELNPQSSDHTKQRVIREGETLSGIAAEEYRNPALWRLIASYPGNKTALRTPRQLEVGATILIPPLDPSTASVFSIQGED